MQLVFNSEFEAVAVEEQLYHVQRQGKILFTVQIDYRALELAVSSAKVKFPRIEEPIVTELKCRLPFPKSERECDNESIPKIYVACLAAYNAGFLHGIWIDATQFTEDIEDDIKWMLSWSPVADYDTCEEWAIHDYDNFHGLSLGEYESLDYVSKVAQALDNATEPNAIAAWLDYAKNLVYDPDIEKLVEEFNYYYCGRWDSERDFALSDEIKEIFNWQEFENKFRFWSFHVDWDSIAYELFITDYFSIEASPGIYVFREFHG